MTWIAYVSILRGVMIKNAFVRAALLTACTFGLVCCGGGGGGSSSNVFSALNNILSSATSIEDAKKKVKAIQKKYS